MPPTAPPAPDARLALAIEQLCRAIAARSVKSGLALPLLILAWSWLRRTTARFARLAERRRAGKLSAPGPRRRRPAASRPPDRRQRMPQGSGWLIRLVPEASASASQLQHLLQDPAMAALIAAAPQAGRLLRPLCRMLGVDPGPLRLPRRPRPARAAAPRAQPPPAPHPAAPAWWPQRPTRAWLRRTGLPGRRRPDFFSGPA